MEALGRLLLEHAEDGLQVVIIPTDPTVKAEEVQIIREEDFPFAGADQFLWVLDPDGSTVLAFDPLGIGGTVIVDREGRISFHGRLTHVYEELKEEIERVL